MSSIKPLIAAPRNSAPSQATHHADESSPEQRAQEEIAVEDSKQSHEQGEYEHETAPPEHTTYKEKVDGATTAKDLPYAMHVLAPVPRESRGSHMRAQRTKLTGAERRARQRRRRGVRVEREVRRHRHLIELDDARTMGEKCLLVRAFRHESQQGNYDKYYE